MHQYAYARTHTHTHTAHALTISLTGPPMCVCDGGLVKSVISTCCAFVVLVRINNDLGSQYCFDFQTSL